MIQTYDLSIARTNGVSVDVPGFLVFVDNMPESAVGSVTVRFDAESDEYTLKPGRLIRRCDAQFQRLYLTNPAGLGGTLRLAIETTKDFFDNGGSGSAVPEFHAIENGFGTGASPMGIRFRSGGTDFSGALPGVLFYPTAAGAPVAVIDTALTGLLAWRSISAAATINGKAASFITPMQKEFSTLPATTQRRRYTFRCLAWRQALAANVGFGIGLKNLQNCAPLNFNGGGGVHGFELYSINTLNGGNWTVRSRQSGVAAPVNGADTGILPTNNPQAMEFIYTEGANPTVEIKIGGVTVATFQGPVNMIPITETNVLGPQWTTGDNPGSGVGATDWLALSEYLIERI